MSNKTFQILFLFCFVISLNAQQISRQKENMFLGNWVFSLDGGTTYSMTDYKDGKLGLTIRGAGEYFFDTGSNSIFSLRLFVASDKITGEDDRQTIGSIDSTRRFISPTFNTDIISAGLGITYTHSIKNSVFPFVGIGISGIWFYPKDQNGNPSPGSAGGLYKKSTQSFFVEGGFRFAVSYNVSLNLAAGMHIALSDYLDDVAAGKNNDAYLTGLLGISFAPFAKSKDVDVIPPVIDEHVPVEEEIKSEEVGVIETEVEEIPDTAGVTPIEPEIIVDTEEEVVPTVDSEPYPPERITLSADDIFGSFSSRILYEAKGLLDSVVTLLSIEPDANWRIEGHMDSQGNEKLIRTLSFERARAILEYLESFGGLDKAKFEILGMGDKFPVGNNNTEEGRKANRRIEIIRVD
jgi:outer membrane protein OmpA-like peptidoglycan-associated protein